MSVNPSVEPEAAPEHAADVSILETARVALSVASLAVLVWGVCQLLAGSIEAATGWLFETARSISLLDGQLLIIGVLVVGGTVRAILMRWPSWEDTSINSFNIALDNYESTSGPGSTPGPRFQRPDFRFAAKKTIATFLTIGTGGAGGITAPMVAIGEALGAGWARTMGVKSVSELRTCQLAAIAAVIATLFRTPFAGALFAIEIMYEDRIVYRKFAFCLLAAVVAYGLTEFLVPLDPVYIPPPNEGAYGIGDYAVTTLVAVLVSGPVALGFNWVMTRARIVVERQHPYMRAIVGTLLTGVIAVVLWEVLGVDPEHVLGVGKKTIRSLFAGDNSDLQLWWFLAVIVVARMITVALTAGSGGSIGLFLPAAFFGGVSGAAVAEMINAWGSLGTFDPVLFVVVGIASALVAVIRIPLTAIALTIEIFGTAYGPAAALACAITYLISLRFPNYRNRPRLASQTIERNSG